jgi:hypothetical protein
LGFRVDARGIQIGPFFPFNNEKNTFEKPKNWFVVPYPGVIVIG